MKLLSVREMEIDEARAAGKPIPKTLSPEWLKFSPEKNTYYVRAYDSTKSPKGLFRAIGPDLLSGYITKARALAAGEKIVLKWLGEDPRTGEKTRVRFKQVANEFMQEYAIRLKQGTIRPKTMTNARFYIGKGLIPDIGEYFIDEIESAWKRYEHLYRLKNPTKRFYNHWKAMSGIMNFARQMGYIDRPWLAKNNDPKTRAGRVLTPEERVRLVQNADGDLRDQLAFAMTMGMRLREHLHLSWDRVDLEANTILLRPEDTKTHKGRIMAMSPEVRKVIDRRWKERSKAIFKSPYVFPAPKDRMKPVDSNKSAWVVAKAKAGITGRFRYHDLRHTFLTECSKLIRTGQESMVTICTYAGLKPTVFERIYLHLNHEDTAGVAGLVSMRGGLNTPTPNLESVSAGLDFAKTETGGMH